jgi:hypothetical protein
MNNIPVTHGIDHPFWSNRPYPHLVIDHWWDDHFQLHDVRKELSKLYEGKNETTYKSTIEANKHIYNEDSNVGRLLKPFADKLESAEFVSELEKMTGIDKIFPLTIFNNDKSTDYKYFHRMYEGGQVGKHVDHSQIYSKKGKVISPDYVHFLNAIFYVEGCEEGGATVLHDKQYNIYDKSVRAEAGRLLLFLHNSNSWHSVNPIIKCPVPRTTIYMDYYCRKEELHKLGLWNQFWKHRTTFIPKTVEHWRYVPWYVEWLLRRKLV